jgi:hypothetical protein
MAERCSACGVELVTQDEADDGRCDDCTAYAHEIDDDDCDCDSCRRARARRRADARLREALFMHEHTRGLAEALGLDE